MFRPFVVEQLELQVPRRAAEELLDLTRSCHTHAESSQYPD